MGLCSTKVDKILPDASQFWSCVVCSKHAEWEAHNMVSCTCPMRIHFPFSHSLTVTRFSNSASNDNVRLWNTELESSFNIYPEGAERPSKTSSTIPFTILPGHHGGCISHIGKDTFQRKDDSESQTNKERMIVIDPTCRYMITTSGNRGWDGVSTNACLFYDIASIV